MISEVGMDIGQSQSPAIFDFGPIHIFSLQNQIPRTGQKVGTPKVLPFIFAATSVQRRKMMEQPAGYLKTGALQNHVFSLPFQCKKNTFTGEEAPLTS